MSTTIRAEVSEKNPYWIEKHRYYELKHFCMQYPFWKKMYKVLDGFDSKRRNLATFIATNVIGDPTAKIGIARKFYSDRIDMIERTAKEADWSLAPYLIKGVTEGLSYDVLKARTNVPCCKDTYYHLYRKFFWILNRERK